MFSMLRTLASSTFSWFLRFVSTDRHEMNDAAFCARLPKTELHAHITGSIMPAVLHTIWQEQKVQDPSFDLGDPTEVLEKALKDMDSKSFFPIFSKYIYRLCNTRARIQTCTRSVLADFANNGVDYLELRSIPRPAVDITKEGYIQTVLEVLDDPKNNPAPARTYLILGVDRKDSPEEALNTVSLAIKYKDQGVVGVDLSGNPSKCDTTQFGDAYRAAKEAGLKITLHFAETEHSSREEELQALLTYEPDRLGHVINVPEHIRKEIRDRKIGVEVCLTSNVAMKMVPTPANATDADETPWTERASADKFRGGYPDHHFQWWRENAPQCPLAICTDDVGIFRSTTAHEYELLMKHFGLTRRDIISLARSSVDCIFGSESDKMMMQQKLDKFEASVDLRED